ncbi:hypothetical protein [Chitinophaga sancti]|uniref:Uncharacterized protein n=1 Tax=Chitinophaga sancti TaxID=1004 RepID=A0A1K1SWB0_9BACT|nr:hypothetical protein [Chitinophaga sancti]WQD63120.1 hypothetical protein U0033_01840 [Chitinophaga sancti]WQG91255.1 hypothetical protein SR876_07075 [Chitinophaga sancti]SFW88680.1 hypothetical protein SAMN05661012_06294 [Chitinophaga sancti]
MKIDIKYTTAISAGLLMSFFIPWIRWSIFKYSGYQLPPIINTLYFTGKLTIGEFQSYSIAIFLYLIPIFCVLSLVRDMTGFRLIPVVTEFVAGLVLTGAFYYYIARYDREFIGHLSIGYYLTVGLSVLGLLVGIVQAKLASRAA